MNKLSVLLCFFPNVELFYSWMNLKMKTFNLAIKYTRVVRRSSGKIYFSFLEMLKNLQKTYGTINS